MNKDISGSTFICRLYCTLSLVNDRNHCIMDEDSADVSDGEGRTLSIPLPNEDPTDPSSESTDIVNNVENDEKLKENTPKAATKSVLSKHQAKSRLKAFSLLKQNYLPQKVIPSVIENVEENTKVEKPLPKKPPKPSNII